MADRATISRHYHIRMLLIGLGGLLMGLYFLYDGMVKYPHEQFISLEYQRVKEEHGNDYLSHWKKLAHDNGWSDADPGPPWSAWDIYTQRGIAYGLIPIGCLVLIFFLLNLRKWVEMDDEGLRDHARRTIAWEDIRRMDKSRWQTKGIAVVYFHHQGKDQRLVLDEWKYDRRIIGAIVERIDRQLRTDDEQADVDATSDET